MSTIVGPIAANDCGPFPGWRGLIFEEDAGLKEALSGFQVYDNGGKTRPVNFYFGNPQREMLPQLAAQGSMGDTRAGAQITYPNVTLTFLRMDRDPMREHRGFVFTVYERNSAMGLADGAGNLVLGTEEIPIPLKLTYQIKTTATNVQHSRQLLGMLAMTVLLPRRAQLFCPSGTVRRMDIVSGPIEIPQLDKNEHRFFSNVWIVEVSSEIEWGAEVPGLIESILVTTENTETSTIDDVLTIT